MEFSPVAWHCLQFNLSGWETLISAGAAGPAWQARQFSLICRLCGITGGLPGSALLPMVGAFVFTHLLDVNVLVVS
jgi:hypothetical protein